MWVPDARLAVLYVAVPEPSRAPGPRTVDPSLNVTVPVGAAVPVAGVTFAVKVMSTPRFAVAAEETTVVFVAIAVTMTATGFDVDGAKLVSPEYCALIESEPAGSGTASVATPEAFSVSVPRVLLPRRKVTVPVGAVVFPVGPVMVAVNVMGCVGIATVADAWSAVAVVAGTT